MKTLFKYLLVLLVCYPVLAIDLWNIDKPQEMVPSSKIEGNIYGRIFELGSASYNNSTLTISSKNKLGHWPESELIIFVDLTSGKKEWLVTPSSEDQIPHIHMKFGKEGSSFPGTLMYISEYSMYLTIVNIDKNSVTLKIHVSLPDYKKSFLIGEFTAERS